MTLVCNLTPRWIFCGQVSSKFSAGTDRVLHKLKQSTQNTVHAHPVKIANPPLSLCTSTGKRGRDFRGLPKTKTGACHWSLGHFGVLGATWPIQTQSHRCTQACPAYRSKLWPLGPFGMSPTSQSPAGIGMELALLPVDFSSYTDCPHHGCPYLSD